MEKAYLSRWGQLTESDKLTANCFDEIIPLVVEWAKITHNCPILLEAPDDTQSLSKKQIQQLFIKVVQAGKYKDEQGSLDDYDPTSSGEGEIEKGTKEKASKIKGFVAKKLKEIKDKLQDSEAVKNFDAKAEEVIGNIKNKLGDDHKAVKAAKSIGEYATKHPKITNFAIGALVAAASFASSPIGGAAAGMLLRSAVGMMKGEKASTAIGKAAMVTGIGLLTGAAVKGLSELVTDGLYPKISMNADMIGSDVAKHTSIYTINGERFSFSFLVNQDMIDQIKEIKPGSDVSFGSEEYFTKTAKWLATLEDMQANTDVQQSLADSVQTAKDANAEQYLKNLDINKAAELATRTMKSINSTLGSIAQGAGQAVAGSKKP